ncbi:RICIN domain-containing protein [Streptomyces sp. NPDC002144]
MRPATGDNQLWYLATGDDNHYRIRNDASGGLCLGVTGSRTAGHDARLQIEPCSSTADDWAWTTG